MQKDTPPLGGMSARTFLRQHWQKRPLLIRQAVPGFKGIASRSELFALARRDEVESRLVRQSRGWHVCEGPIARRDLSELGLRRWTLLVNGLNLVSDQADRLLRRFSFVPWSRLDDIMVSHAADGGGVGAHVDSYDVFLLQGMGRRRWRVASPQSWEMTPNTPLRQVRNFRHESEMILDAGDMLYLPPGWAHEGTAMGECQTYSVGFRAPGGAELGAAFLDFLHEKGMPDGSYRDPGRHPTSNPGRLDAHMIEFAVSTLGRVRWNRADVARFMGQFLTEPKPHVIFAPGRPISPAQFTRRIQRAGIRLDRRSLLLVHGRLAYMNGEALELPVRSRRAVSALADKRSVSAEQMAGCTADEFFFDWYRLGYVHVQEDMRRQP